jgi:HEAT repeat protein
MRCDRYETPTSLASGPSSAGAYRRAVACTAATVISLLAAAAPLVAQTAAEKAWAVLQAGLVDKDVSQRATAVRVLGLLEGNPKAAELALTALHDEKPEVRTAAAIALGRLGGKSAAPKLVETIKGEKDVAVVMAGARSLVALGDSAGYAVYYAVLTGERKTGGSLLDEQKKMLSDPKKMAQFGFEQGIGFIPFASLGYGVLKKAKSDDTSLIRAAAAKILAADEDPKSSDALVVAAADKSWIVRAAALDALSQRDDPAVMSRIELRLADESEAVRFTAAAAIVHLQDVQARGAAGRKN